MAHRDRPVGIAHEAVVDRRAVEVDLIVWAALTVDIVVATAAVEHVEAVTAALRLIERFWSDQIRYIY